MTRYCGEIFGLMLIAIPTSGSVIQKGTLSISVLGHPAGLFEFITGGALRGLNSNPRASGQITLVPALRISNMRVLSPSRWPTFGSSLTLSRGVKAAASREHLFCRGGRRSLGVSPRAPGGRRVLERREAFSRKTKLT